MTINVENISRIRHECGLIPFWFWNDDLSEDELLRQMADFEDHGVHGFVIHPRIGLPHRIGWMSEEWLHYVSVAVEEAARRGMKVVLYDEAMYPSGSSGGQIVAADPRLQTRCLDKVTLLGNEEPSLQDGWNLIGVYARTGQRFAVVDRPTNCRIRGIHYIGEGPEEESPLLADILNPAAVAKFIELVYEGHARHLQPHFGQTIIGIFTDEPVLYCGTGETSAIPGTTGIIEHVNRILGYDFSPHLPALWFDNETDSLSKRIDYRHALQIRLNETFYQPLHNWCNEHGLALMGHPAGPGEMRHERCFHIPGQDVVWRYVVPGETAVQGSQSTTAKCASSAALHCGRRFNSMESYGAYGHELTWEEMVWLANWCFVRGINMLIPHAFYYSVRGPRRDERPPDVGPNSPWWDRYIEFANHCASLSYLNTDSQHVCNIAILTDGFHLPWEAAKVCFESQHDFNYLDVTDLLDAAEVSERGITIGQMTYGLLILDDSQSSISAYKPVRELATHGRVVCTSQALAVAEAVAAKVAVTPAELVTFIDQAVGSDITLSIPQPNLRVRHIRKDGCDFYLLFNEGETDIDCGACPTVSGHCAWLEPSTVRETPLEGDLKIMLSPYETKVLMLRQ